MAKLIVDFAYHRVLLGTAESQAEEHQHPIAIVTAQMALEVRVEEAFTTLFSLRDGLPVAELVALLPDRTMMQTSVKRLWEALTGDRISKASAWSEYQRHVERRNRLAHGSEQWSNHRQAEASLAAVTGMIEHIDRVVAAAIAGARPILAEPIRHESGAHTKRTSTKSATDSSAGGLPS